MRQMVFDKIISTVGNYLDEDTSQTEDAYVSQIVELSKGLHKLQTEIKDPKPEI